MSFTDAPGYAPGYEYYVLRKLAWVLDEAEKKWEDETCYDGREVNVILNRKPDWDVDAMVRFAEEKCFVLEDKIKQKYPHLSCFKIDIGVNEYEFSEDDDTIVKWEIYIRWEEVENPFSYLREVSKWRTSYDSDDE